MKTQRIQEAANEKENDMKLKPCPSACMQKANMHVAGLSKKHSHAAGALVTAAPLHTPTAIQARAYHKHAGGWAPRQLVWDQGVADAVLSLKDVRKNSDASTPLGNMDFEGEAG
eukprot:351963-Chlamydomonas_euryale.AAC.9